MNIVWIFAAYGYLLPVITVADDELRDDIGWDEHSVGGKFTFQVRARLREHLEYYLENFAEEGTYGPIWRTPHHDYNFRVMTTQEAFAEAMKKSILAIDYRNFKDQSKKYPRGKDYHDLLLDVWADSCFLNTPGGMYGPKSSENPHGYGSARSHYGYYAAPGRRIGDTFKNIVFDDDDETEEYDEFDSAALNPDGSYSWTPTTDQLYKAHELQRELESYNIDMEDWADFVSPREFEILKPLLKERFNKKEIRSMKNRNKKAFEVT